MINVLNILEVRHGQFPGWLEFKLRVRWQDGSIKELPFTYNPDDTAPLTRGLKEHVVPTLDQSSILPALEPKVGQATD